MGGNMQELAGRLGVKLPKTSQARQRQSTQSASARPRLIGSITLSCISDHPISPSIFGASYALVPMLGIFILVSLTKIFKKGLEKCENTLASLAQEKDGIQF